MEERSNNKAIMCSVLFLEIIEYSRRTVAGQISLKDRFVSYLSIAIRDVPAADRIIIDTGDGAAINFLGDVEHAFKVALSLRENLLNGEANLGMPLQLRMGINLGPVRMVRDVNGQPNIVGDGINVAERIMGFADVGQILVSRSYFEAVSRFSPQHAGLFQYQGSRTDKHVREHEVYAIICPDGHPERQMPDDDIDGREAPDQGNDAVGYNPAQEPASPGLFGTRQRAMYVGAIAMAMVLAGALALKLARHDKIPAPPDVGVVKAVSNIQQESAVHPEISAAPITEDKTIEKNVVQPVAPHPGTKKADGRKTDSKKTSDKAKHPEAQPKNMVPEAHEALKAPETAHKVNVPVAATGSSAEKNMEAFISISCEEGTRIFVDGMQKGKVGPGLFTLALSPGKHKVIVSHASGNLYTQNVDLEPGKTVRISPNICK